MKDIIVYTLACIGLLNVACMTGWAVAIWWHEHRSGARL